MKKVGLYYNFDTQKTSKVAKKVKEEFEKGGKYELVEVNADEHMTDQQFMAYDYMVIGASTWMDGELPYYWDEFVPAVEDLSMEGKKVAIFGLGDQSYSYENFVDAIGILAYLLEGQGAKLYGFTSTEGYNFVKSAGVRDHQFMGLAIDLENQAALTNERVENWVKQLKKEFEK